MQIVVDIPEEIYKASQIIDVKHEDVIQIPLEVIKNGTPLPKGHGELKDTKAILDKFDDAYISNVGLVPDNLAEGFVQCEELIKTATTLVKADKAERRIRNE